MSGKRTLADWNATHLTADEEHQLRKDNRELRRQLDAALESRKLDQKYEQFITSCLGAKVAAPKWTVAPSTGKGNEVMPVLQLSDWHFDEVVRPAEVQGKNAYNREIAERRLALCFEATARICRDYLHGFRYPGFVLSLEGDLFSGNIHEELKETNADKVLSSLLHWLEPVSAGITLLADTFGKVFIPAVVGNHGRMTKKPIMKMRAKDNFDWLFAHLLRREFEKRKDPRVTWQIEEGHKALFNVYDTRFLASHGDEARGGSGIAGMLSPQLIAFSRMKKVHDFDIWLLGHWHTLGAYRNIRVNGSGVGYNEMALINNFDYQKPMQDLFFVGPKVGVVAQWPVFCANEQTG